MNKFRLAGWLAVGGLLGAALLAPSAAFATDLKEAQQGTSWNDQGFQGSAEECKKLDLGPGDVVWHFVLTSPEADSGHLTATFQNAGDVTVANADSPAAVLHFYVWTGHDTLLDAETTDVDGNNLVLSHICAGKEEASESVPVETESVPVESEPVESEPVETQPVESIPVESVPVESVPVGVHAGRVGPRRERPGRHAVRRLHPCDPCRPDADPQGSVEAATGTPNEDVTPPSTDTLTPTNTTAVQRRLAAGAHRPGRPDRLRAGPDPGHPQDSPLRDIATGSRPAGPPPRATRRTGAARPRSSAVRAALPVDPGTRPDELDRPVVLGADRCEGLVGVEAHLQVRQEHASDAAGRREAPDRRAVEVEHARRYGAGPERDLRRAACRPRR